MYRFYPNRALLAFILVLLVGSSYTWSSKLKKKIHATIRKTYNIEAYTLDTVSISGELEDKTPVTVGGSLYLVRGEDRVHGYAYVGEAPSMKNVFDYIVLFDKELTIVDTKVLIYRENHGRQIGTRRWLKQFFGMTYSDVPRVGQEIDGISGATISVTSMTEAVREVLQSVNILHTNQVFDAH